MAKNSKGRPKRPPQSKQSRKRKSSVKGRQREYNPEYHNLIIIFLGLFIGYGLMSSSGALLPRIIQLIFKGLFGGLAILVPLVLVLAGITGFIHNNEKINRIRRTKMKYIIPIFLILYYGLINYAQSPSSSPLRMDEIQDIIKMGVSREGMGLIPSFATYYLTHLLGLVGAWLIVVFATIICILQVMDISIADMIELAQNPSNGRANILSKLKVFNKNKTNVDGIEETTLISKTGIFSKIKDKFKKNDQDSPEEEDDTDKTIKIVGFNKAEDDYLEILEGTQSLSDLEVLQKLQQGDLEGIDGITPNLKDIGPKSKLMGGPGQIVEPEKEDLFEEENEHIKYANYKMPPVSLLNKVVNKSDKRSKQKVLENARRLEQTLRDFGVEASINQVTVGPTITRYEIQPRPGVKVSKIVNLTDDIALSLAAKSIRMEAPIPGKNAIGIEVPNEESQMVGIREIIESKEFNGYPSKLAMGLGKDVAGRIIIGDIAKMPHLLIAGSTGSGKSVCVNTLITSLVYKAKPDEVKLILIDPKVVELSNYNGIPHLLIPVVTDPKKAANALTWAVTEMNRRYKLFADTQVKDIKSYNEKTDNPLPRIVIIIDELADLMMVSANDVEDCIHRLAQMARAAGMHLIVATQRPSVDVITGVIKANIPSRIAFAVSSQTDSRTIIDMGGAEKLLGKGDMLFYPLGAAKPVRLQGAFISEAESDKIIEHIKNEVGEHTYADDIEEKISNVNTDEVSSADELLVECIEFVVANGQASASMLQRKFKIGFNRAARLIDDMEERGIVGPSEGSKPRKVLISKQDLEGLL
ncbi:DNA translocase FtsK [Peptostreptococcus anaerobius]|uniref:DNA translocase FtsK n=1 Tax=Peptostreptococcus anaerobius TaxID=1261 RepID=UPI0023314AC3|nr:DNA translocase FtsK [Peptostreptococcus anaerobius]MDB8821335.1 DNA translocase FtsK [Peptostreptococcus anaerobius]MDB8826019.1 DNA translocase FtsK [Peptostreptococcus anaerobius]MDB8827820.1 DNA translocase FtsK [Peptostreptococcus anaerobius]MDB8829637.1 DNA translocase FtsK [Peptostreptococcus anaerobius]MDB8831500.1 DNA translocase FtsK [Peptostreptococcus anaerobius]